MKLKNELQLFSKKWFLGNIEFMVSNVYKIKMFYLSMPNFNVKFTLPNL